MFLLSMNAVFQMFSNLGETHWTLLVNEVNRHVPEVRWFDLGRRNGLKPIVPVCCHAFFCVCYEIGTVVAAYKSYSVFCLQYQYAYFRRSRVCSFPQKGTGVFLTTPRSACSSETLRHNLSLPLSSTLTLHVCLDGIHWPGRCRTC